MAGESFLISPAFQTVFSGHNGRERTNKQRFLLVSTLILSCLAWTFYFSCFYTPKNRRVPPASVSLLTVNVGLLHDQKSMLNNEQLSHLKDITSGLLSRKHVEIVISRHNEEITWSDMYASIRTIYDKSDTPNLLKIETPGKVIRLPNLGRESHTYLTHIVNNYNKLAELTVFSQGSAPFSGYDGHRNGGGHVLTNSSFHDFVLNEKGHFIFTGAIWLKTIAHLLRSGFHVTGASRWQALQQCPSPVLTDPGGSEFRFDLDDPDSVHVLRHIASLCITEGSVTCNGLSFWESYIRLPFPKDHIIFFAQGAIFSATAKQIRRRPLEDYQRLLAEVSKSSDTAAGFFLEWMWYYVVTSDISPCPVTGHEFDWATKNLSYKDLQFPERMEFTKDKRPGP